MEGTVDERLTGSQSYISTTCSTWWIDALSIIITEWGLIQLNACMNGCRQLRIKSAYVSPLTVPSQRYTSCMPSMDMTGIVE